MNDDFYQGLVSGFGNGVRLYDAVGDARARARKRDAEKDLAAGVGESMDIGLADADRNTVRAISRRVASMPSNQQSASGVSQTTQFPATAPTQTTGATPSMQGASQFTPGLETDWRSYAPPDAENSAPTALAQYRQPAVQIPESGKKKVSR